jgi:hypothetical protein
MDPIEELRFRIAALEKECLILAQAAAESSEETARVSLAEHAFRLAVRSLGKEIAEQHGISGPLFEKRMQALTRWHHDQLLQTTGDEFPGWTASIDTRTVEQIPTDDTPPKLFGPQSDG